MNSTPSTQSHPRERKTTLATFLILLIGTLVLTFRMVHPYLLAFMMGAILAILFYPIYRYLRARRIYPNLASFLVILLIVFLVMGPLAFFIYRAIHQGIAVAKQVSENNILSFDSLINSLNQWGPIQSLIPDPAVFEKQVIGMVQNSARTGSQIILGVAKNIPEILLQSALALISTFFLLIDGKQFSQWMVDKIPLDRDTRLQIISSFKNTAISVVWATIAAALAQALMMFFAFFTLGVPAGFLAAGATFIFAWIPMIGSLPVWVAGAIYLYTQGAIAKVFVMIVLGLITGVVDNIVRPLVLKGRGEMHPLVSLIAIFGGISMFGIFGVFVGPILIAILIALLQIWPAIGMRFGLLPPVKK